MKLIKQTAWVPSISNWVKLNIDSECKDYLIVWCRGVNKNEDGRCLGGFAKFFGLSNVFVFVAESWDLYEGFKLTLSRGFKKVEANVDSSMVVQATDK